MSEHNSVCVKVTRPDGTQIWVDADEVPDRPPFQGNRLGALVSELNQVGVMPDVPIVHLPRAIADETGPERAGSDSKALSIVGTAALVAVFVLMLGALAVFALGDKFAEVASRIH